MNNKITFVFLILLMVVVGVFFLIKNFSVVKVEPENSIKLKSEVMNKNMVNSTTSLKILMIIAWRGFRDEEYFEPKKVFEENGFQVTTASTQKGTAVGVNGGEAKIDISLTEINLNDYQAVVFSGGPKTLDYLDNQKVYQIVQQTVQEKKGLGAICMSPVILAKARVLKDKQATVWSSVLNRKPVKILKENGAQYINQLVVRDGLIITANGPSAATEFGREVVKTI
ncbi:MAG TPA: DJ-1/PfpI family protein, partial [Candidatus Portnoybacteria bacterium]|nr:DJ-1/PfpI family protein [Candidatus Portnoybacteria bacterium]